MNTVTKLFFKCVNGIMRSIFNEIFTEKHFQVFGNWYDKIFQAQAIITGAF